MPSRAFYLQQAKSYFDMATMTRDQDVRNRWIDRANEYLILADALGDDEPPAIPPTTQPQAQQMQQQQERPTDENNC